MSLKDEQKRVLNIWRNAGYIKPSSGCATMYILLENKNVYHVNWFYVVQSNEKQYKNIYKQGAKPIAMDIM